MFAGGGVLIQSGRSTDEYLEVLLSESQAFVLVWSAATAVAVAGNMEGDWLLQSGV